jgi:ABC-2 type transport system ATP-binding protein
MIRLERLSKSFRGKPALEELTLEIPAGQIFGLLGHNGAGKSTTFGLILGQLHPTGGEAFVRGISVAKDRLRALQKVGAIFETPAFYDYLSGWNNLRIFTGCSAKLSRSELMETVGFVGLEERIHDPVRVYSHGMRQRLALAQALLPRPELILLDEPAEGLDPEGIHEMRHLILRLNKERGMTVLLSSHLLAEVEQICDRVAVLNKGRLIFQGPWSELGGGQSGAECYRLQVDDWTKVGAVISACGATLAEGGLVTLASGADIADVVAALVHAGVRVRAVEPVRRTLEEMYLNAIQLP